VERLARQDAKLLHQRTEVPHLNEKIFKDLLEKHNSATV